MRSLVARPASSCRLQSRLCSCCSSTAVSWFSSFDWTTGSGDRLINDHAMPEQVKHGNKKPLQLVEPDVSRGLLERFQLTTLLKYFDDRHVWAAFMFVNGFITIGSLALLAMVTHTPFIFPSLGPTAFLFFFSPTL